MLKVSVKKDAKRIFSKCNYLCVHNLEVPVKPKETCDRVFFLWTYILEDLEKYSRSCDETWHVFSTSLA